MSRQGKTTGFEVLAVELPDMTVVRECTQFSIALTRQYPCSRWPNSVIANFLRRSD
jgi:hypothetical protein